MGLKGETSLEPPTSAIYPLSPVVGGCLQTSIKIFLSQGILTFFRSNLVQMLDPMKLAKLNIALNAAFLAADAGLELKFSRLRKK
jgi:hypothetical protein